LTLVPSAIAVIVAIFVPWFTFRFELKQNRVDRLRDQRAQLYVDLLTEATAEQKWFEHETADDKTRERMRPHFHDLRLPRWNGRDKALRPISSPASRSYDCSTIF
jgi:hypothetical protein